MDELLATVLANVLAVLVMVVVGAVVPIIIVGYIEEGWRPRLSLPPYQPPSGQMMWKGLAAVRICPKPKLPCGCRAEWGDVGIFPEPDADGTLERGVMGYADCTRDWETVRKVEVDNAGVQISTDRRPIHRHPECGGSWMESLSRDYPFTVADTLPYPRPSENMRALPASWTRIDRGLSEKAGQVSEYVEDDGWEAFVDVYDTAHDGNNYDPGLGSHCAVLMAGSPEEGLWEMDQHYADGRSEAAKPLMEAWNDGEYE